MPSKTEEKTEVTFRSKDDNLTLVWRPERRRYNERGELEVLPGQRFAFTEGVLLISEPEELEFLRGHRLFQNRFWEVGNEPDRVHPSVEEAMTDIAKAAAKQDSETIAAIFQQEVESHDRETVKSAAQAAMVAIEEGSADVEVEAEK